MTKEMFWLLMGHLVCIGQWAAFIMVDHAFLGRGRRFRFPCLWAALLAAVFLVASIRHDIGFFNVESVILNVIYLLVTVLFFGGSWNQKLSACLVNGIMCLLTENTVSYTFAWCKHIPAGETAEETEGSSKEDSDDNKKGFFKKKKDKKDEQIEDLTDRLRRQMAEFENFRKRTEKEKSQMFDMGAKTIVEKVLPVIDNFERGLAAVPEDKKEDAFVVGMDKIYKQFLTTLEEAGVKPIEAVGQEFDPNFHNAVMHVEDEELGENIVAEELQKGYMYRDAVVRHSMVKVAN